MWRDAVALLQGRSPRQVILQLTDSCNAQCPQCSMRAGNEYPRTRMTRAQATRIVERAAELDVSALSLTGGEPLLCLEDVKFLVHRATSLGIRHTRTGTNGYLFTASGNPRFYSRIGKLVHGLSESGLRNLWISLDSADVETHERLRGLPGVVAGIEKALPVFHSYGLYPAANLGLTRAMGVEPIPRLADVGAPAFSAAVRAGLTAFFARVIDLGFTMANVCYPMSVPEDQDDLLPAYLATADDPLVRFSAAEKSLLFATLRDVIAAHRARIRVFTPLSSLDALAVEHGDGGYACRGGIDYFFVDPHGDTYPCGYRGDHWLGPFVTFRPRRRLTRPTCRRCEWECFRDPSELFGPVTGRAGLPLTPARLLLGSDPHLRLWWEDVRYAGACGLFDGRRAPDARRLAAFAPPAAPAADVVDVVDRASAPHPSAL